jgi:hypothetical protein
MKKNKSDNNNPYKCVRIGWYHFLRGGAGIWKDRKKEHNRMICRKKDNEDG